MTKLQTIESAFLTFLMFAVTALGLLIVTPAAAKPLTEAQIRERIDYICEASTIDMVGRRMENECRAEWRAKLQQAAERQAREQQAKLAQKK